MKKMKAVYLLGVLSLLIAGCSNHYYRIDQEGLSLYLKSEDARNVFFFSSLDGFTPHETKKYGGQWVITIPDSREFRYFYLVDGEVYTPECPLREIDDFGKENCVYIP
ncbi:hypothetical protein ACFL0H_08510 [Thermodesulfobacteriota bacterium]